MRNLEFYVKFVWSLWCAIILTKAKPLDSGSHATTTTHATKVACGHSSCDVVIQYCDRSVQNCFMCRDKCAGKIDVFMQQECRTDCPVYMESKDKEQLEQHSKAGEDKEGTPQPNSDLLSNLMQQLHTALPVYNYAASSKSPETTMLVILIVMMTLLIVIAVLLAMIATVLCKRQHHKKNADKKRHQNGVQPQEHAPAGTNMTDPDETTPLTVYDQHDDPGTEPAHALQTEDARRESADAIASDRYHNGEVEAGIRGRELENNQNLLIDHGKCTVNYCKKTVNVVPHPLHGYDVTNMQDADETKPLFVDLDPVGRGDAGKGSANADVSQKSSTYYHSGEVEAGTKGDELGKNLRLEHNGFTETQRKGPETTMI